MLIAAYLVEAGLVLTIAPWTQFWEHNYFALAYPLVGDLMGSPYMRGGVTGIGLVTVVAGLRDLAFVLANRRRDTPSSTVEPPRV